LIRWLNALEASESQGNTPAPKIIANKTPSGFPEGAGIDLCQLELIDHVGREHDFVHFGAGSGDSASERS